MTDPNLIRQIEELSMNAFPPLHSIHDDGWVMQIGSGYPRRVNAVYPLYAGSKTLEEKIGNCEALYRAQGLPTIFKLTKASIPATLDQSLTEKGYSTDAHTAVQVLALGGWSGHTDAADVALPAPALHQTQDGVPQVQVSETLTEAWLTALGRMRESGHEHHAIHAQILRRILPERRFASISMDGQIVACGLGVLQNGYIGFYDISTDATVRRQGHSLWIMETLMIWGKSKGATHGYLQVMLNNPPALALYAKLGFKEAYQYWYRARQ